ncbi:glycosyltransferase [Lysinibacter sp. HNR]|uniref:glycosyltransferase n=1 Tax=Lysinibacter sp. HNR TaxID=3031408 RepID=UPI0024354F4A|nr:glycosyltransferase [Lysinibacter sp. HNR]WGD37468.1 glycosyltransferase [Lysinibacter sp. HNR]
MRIALVSLHTNPFDAPGWGDAGGMNVVVRHHAEALADLGHEVEVLTRKIDPNAPDSVLLRPGLTLRTLVAGPIEELSKSAQGVLTSDFEVSMRELAPFDLIHAHHWMSGIAALPLGREWNVPVLMSYHSIAALPGAPLDHGEPPEDHLRVAAEARLAREATRIIAISEAEAQTAIERCGADPERVTVLAPGVDNALFTPLTSVAATASVSAGTSVTASVSTAALGASVNNTFVNESQPPKPAPNDPGYVFIAARLQPLKGIDLAVETLALIPSDIRPRLIVAGEDSIDFAGYRDQLREDAQKAGGGLNITFIGAQTRDRLATWLREAKLVMVPSYSETFGLVALEAAASGVPVIAADTGGLREAVVHGTTGLLLTGRDPHVWAAAIEPLLRDPQRLHTLGVAARHRAEGFDWSLVGERLVALYASLS